MGRARIVRSAAIVVGLDVATKLIALSAFKRDEIVDLAGGTIKLGLVLNTTLVAQSQKAMFNYAGIGSNARLFAGALLIASSTAAHFVVGRVRRTIGKFVLLCLTCFVPPLIGWMLDGPTMPILASDRVVGLVRGAGALMLCSVLIRLFASKYLVVMAAVAFFANAGNFLNMVYYAPGNIDWISFPPFQDRMMNASDIAIQLVLLMAVAYVPLRMFERLSRRWTWFRRTGPGRALAAVTATFAHDDRTGDATESAVATS